MKILILRDTVCGGVPVTAGSVVDASGKDARILITMRKATPAPSQPMHEGGENIETADLAPGETAVRRVPKKGKRG